MRSPNWQQTIEGIAHPAFHRGYEAATAQLADLAENWRAKGLAGITETVRSIRTVPHANEQSDDFAEASGRFMALWCFALGHTDGELRPYLLQALLAKTGVTADGMPRKPPRVVAGYIGLTSKLWEALANPEDNFLETLFDAADIQRLRGLAQNVLRNAPSPLWLVAQAADAATAASLRAETQARHLAATADIRNFADMLRSKYGGESGLKTWRLIEPWQTRAETWRGHLATLQPGKLPEAIRATPAEPFQTGESINLFDVARGAGALTGLWLHVKTFANADFVAPIAPALLAKTLSTVKMLDQDKIGKRASLVYFEFGGLAWRSLADMGSTLRQSFAVEHQPTLEEILENVPRAFAFMPARSNDSALKSGVRPA